MIEWSQNNHFYVSFTQFILFNRLHFHFYSEALMYYSNTPRHQWTALDVLKEQMDPTPPQIYALQQDIEQWIVELGQWDILKDKLLLDDKMVENKKVLSNGKSDH